MQRSIYRPTSARRRRVTDDAEAFQLFRHGARAQGTDTVTLLIPADDYVTSETLPFDGIRSLIVNGAGATILQCAAQQ